MKTNMETMYEEVGGGWHGKAKRREMKTPFMHYLVATDATPSASDAEESSASSPTSGAPLGFVSLLFDIENECEVGCVVHCTNIP